MMDFWLWPLVVRILGEETAQKVASLLAGLARLVEDDPSKSDGQGELKKKAVMNSVIAWLDAAGLWSHWPLHVWFWTGILSQLIDWSVAKLKENDWGVLPGEVELSEDDLRLANA